MNSLIVREVDGDGLAAGVAVSCVVDSVVYVEVRRCSRNECLVFRNTWKSLLELWKQGYILCKVGAALLVLEEDE